jgi:imidazoleglycerol-phosphate dehydratase
VGRVERKTRETDIALELNLDGTGQYAVETTIPFLNHMLEVWSRHGLLDLTLRARGDTDVDLHHTVEDMAICLGQAFKAALGDARGIVRYGTAFVPMDEALVSVVVDCSNRPYLTFNAPLGRGRIGDFDVGMVQHFLRSFSLNAGVTLHVNLYYGENLHHITEAIFKAFGRALGEATRVNPRAVGIPSTKGRL